MFPKNHIKTLADLKKLQKWMKRSIVTPYALQPKELKNQTAYYLTGNSHLNAKERFDIYVNDFWPRILDSLAEDFPELKKLLGEKSFTNWVEKYIDKYPSTSFTLFYLGKNLPQFMKRYYRGKNKKNVLETANFEWAQVKAYVAPGLKGLNPQDLSKKQKENLAHLKIILHPSVSLVDYKNKNWIVYRFQNKVYEQSLKPDLYLLLKLISKKQTLSRSTAALSKHLKPLALNKALAEIHDWFTIAVSREWIVLKIK
jgi:hypothetical protein